MLIRSGNSDLRGPETFVEYFGPNLAQKPGDNLAFGDEHNAVHLTRSEGARE